MLAMINIYRRYFKSHFVGLLLACTCFLGFAAEGSIMAWMNRYLVDEVLQVDQVVKTALNGRREAFVRLDEILAETPERKTVCSDDLTDGTLPGEHLAEPAIMTEPSVDGTLQDRLVNRSGRSNSEKLQLLGIIAVLLIITHLAAVGAQAWANIKVGRIGEQVTFAIRRQIHDKLLRLQMSYHDQHQTGRLLSRAIDDVQVVEGNFAGVLTQWAMFLGIIIIHLGLMYHINPKLATLAVVALPFYAFAYQRLGGKIRSLTQAQRRANGALYGLIRDRLANPRVIKGFGQEKRELLNFYDRTRDLFRRRRKIVVLNNLLSMICTCIAAIMTAVSLGYGVVLLRQGEMTLGYLLFFYALARGLFYPIASLTQLTADMQWLGVACERILDVLDEPVTICDHPKAEKLKKFQTAVTFENVGFFYNDSSRRAVEQANLTLPKGSQICLMGKSGAGKSTLGMLLLRLYDVSEGRILIDGIDLRKIKTTSLRKRISYVPQEPMLFSGTLAANILYGNPDASAEQMIAAAKAAEIDDFVQSMPEKYNTLIGENGLRLSGGQKQRISLARALVTDPDILILDDCTSALDAETEARIQQTFKTALAGKTVLIISHRVSISSNSDLVVVLEKGQVVETGTHPELLDRKEHYWNLIKDQLEEQAVVAIPHDRTAATSAA